MNLKNKTLLLFAKNLPKKRKRFHIRKCHVTMSNKGKNLILWKCHVRMVTMAKKDAYISNDLQLRNHSLTFIHENASLLSATIVLSRSPMVYNTTASLNKLICANYVDFGKCQERFKQLSLSKNDSN